MTIYRCPDCLGASLLKRHCATCDDQRYVNRNSFGRITNPATAEQFLIQERETYTVRPKRVRGKPTRF